MQVTAETYPLMFELFDDLARDGGLPAQECYEVDPPYSLSLATYEMELHALPPEDRRTLATGEESEISDIIAKYSLQDLDEMLCYMFEESLDKKNKNDPLTDEIPF